MALHVTLEEHAADPPETWQAVKVGDHRWHLDSSLGATIGYNYPSKRAAEADKAGGFYFRLYHEESLRFARKLGTDHGSAGTTPFGDLDQDDSPLMTALGETGPTTEDNHPRRLALLQAYRDAYTQVREGTR